jgi:uncharacterized protein YjbJ (UPF0337 family)
MNTEKVEGKFDQVAGKIKQSVGEAVGNQKLANSGVADQVKGAAKETWGHAKDAAGAVHNDPTTKAKAENTAHNVRESITDTARNVRDKVSHKMDEVRNDHKH